MKRLAPASDRYGFLVAPATTPALAAKSLSHQHPSPTHGESLGGASDSKRSRSEQADLASLDWESDDRRCKCGVSLDSRRRSECDRCSLRRRRAQLYAKPCSYEAAHRRVQTARGKASDWRCAKCGGPAEQWAYLGDSPREIRAAREYMRDGRKRTVTLSWSPDPADYVALCALDHGLLTRADYGRGYRHDEAKRRAYDERQADYRKRWYAALKADPLRYAAYLARKRSTSTRNRTINTKEER